MHDTDARMLLTLLHQYCKEFTPDLPQTIPALADDLAVSMDVSRPSDFRKRDEIERLFP